ncbi:tetratricopeptide repeat protein [Acinetobacter shaoyimingii]|uniref:Sel1 repeat family protein n=1 Tax=Acinetobacter shaoyimingii TaxID=2715164 RepID=A0A6G8RRX2_9GAMM|nr:SEL1-like repeat protein [Acinetobacter shaoyimingii]QIO04719.1 sel1 repeat family protein [Acinetobacter shaoyimingii]
MLTYLLKKVRKQNELKNNFHQSSSSEANYELQQAHVFEENISNNLYSNRPDGYTNNQDARNAMWNYLRAALRGDKDAQYKMGLSYLNGQLGLDRNYQHAEKWLSQAANQGHPAAQQELQRALNQIVIS